jgi:enoyl-CoA hydratase/carnithine racemase
MINDTKFEKIAVMDGISIGSGIGLGMICNKRILTDNTIISIPETGIGLITDIGGSYYLPKLINPEFGLYLALTGHKLSGPEAFYTGFSDIYIPKTSEILYQSLIYDDYFDINKYHKTPESSKAHILTKLPLISECFKLSYDIETIIMKLSYQNTPWARNCLEVINDQCPMSLKIVQKLFEKNVNLSYSECLNRELNTVLRYIEKYPQNVNNAVKTRFVDKSQSKLSWAPKTLHDVSSQLVEEICEYSLEKNSYKL